MASQFHVILVLGILTLQWSCSADQANELNKELYIVYMGSLPKIRTNEHNVNSHVHLLASITESEEVARSRIVTSYTKSFNGFAAKLSPDEVSALRDMPEIVSVFRSETKQLHTTRSWDFLGLTTSSPRNTAVESDIVIGLLDTGVWPESKSFNDDLLGPVPSRWKGECQSGVQFSPGNCNRKLIGAKFYVHGYESVVGAINRTLDYLSARDSNGHGSHTSSTVGGSVVKDASLYGLAKGNATGGVPGARIAMYKVCWEEGCTDADILAAFDDAIDDGVDLLSISLGGLNSYYFENTIAIGAFHSMSRGIVVSCSAGNGGPSLFSATNLAPWILTVAASSIDRRFYSPVLLGDNSTIMGMAINTFVMKDSWYPIITGAQATLASNVTVNNYCEEGSLDRKKAKGKIVVCDDTADESILAAGGVGMVAILDEEISLAFPYLLPASSVGERDGYKIQRYINSTRSPKAKILPCDVATQNIPAPLLAFFSSRGPNVISFDILKPDLTAPGEDILAAWSPKDSVTEYPSDKRHVNFNIISGTSMSCPHAAGAAAYVKSFHPDWSPAAIKSALMTTATPLDPTRPMNADLEFGYGAGQINPTAAVHPGLIYDIGVQDYEHFLCTHGYNETQIRLLTGNQNLSCGEDRNTPYLLNYPSVSAATTIDLKLTWLSFPRTVTNVGTPISIYTASITAPPGLEITVSPTTLSFTSLKQKKSFVINVRAPFLGTEAKSLSGSLIWSDGIHSVRSPIVAWTLDS